MNVVAFMFTIVVNALARSTTLLNGKTCGEISDPYLMLITSTGFTFSTWSMIYTLL